MSVEFKLAANSELDNLNKVCRKIFPNFTIRNHNGHENYVIYVDKEFVGFLNLYEGKMFQKYFILPEKRGNGLGKKVLVAAIDFFINVRKVDLNKIYFLVKNNNKIAYDLFAKNNFKVVKNIGNLHKFKRIID